MWKWPVLFVLFSAICMFFVLWPWQKILCEDCFVAVETEVPDKQLLSQILEAIRVTPALHEDLQVEVMKVRARLNLHHQCEVTNVWSVRNGLWRKCLASIKLE